MGEFGLSEFELPGFYCTKYKYVITNVYVTIDQFDKNVGSIVIVYRKWKHKIYFEYLTRIPLWPFALIN